MIIKMKGSTFHSELIISLKNEKSKALNIFVLFVLVLCMVVNA